MVRPAPAPRQLADRRPPRVLTADQVDDEAWLKAACRRPRSTSLASRRCRPATAADPPLPAARRRLGRGRRAPRRPRNSPPTRSTARRTGASRSRRKPTKKQSTRWSSWRDASSGCGRSPCAGCEIAEREIRRDIPVWGAASDLPDAAGAVTREEIEASLADPDGAYRRLRRVMDAWCALWFWPLTDDRHVEAPYPRRR